MNEAVGGEMLRKCRRNESGSGSSSDLDDLLFQRHCLRCERLLMQTKCWSLLLDALCCFLATAASHSCK